MGRRALPKINPTIDYSAWFIDGKQLPDDWKLASLFAKDQPLEIEVGTGKGLFINSESGRVPTHNYLGIEIAQKYARFSASRLCTSGRTNAIMMAGDATALFKKFVPDQSLAAVHVYFPDPWWKKRHRRRRVLNPHFMRDIERTLKIGGTLHFWTDVQEYFESALADLATSTYLEGPLEVAEIAPEHDLDYRTHFERRKRQLDLPIYRSEFRKVKAECCAAPLVSLEESEGIDDPGMSSDDSAMLDFEGESQLEYDATTIDSTDIDDDNDGPNHITSDDRSRRDTLDD